MGKGFTARVKRVISEADIILEVVDSRFPQETRNHWMEQTIVEKKKKLIIIANKADLVSVEKVRRVKRKLAKEFPCVFVSAKERFGKKKLLEEIGKASHKKEIKIGIIGYPNTGKSSITNMLRGKKVAKTSRKAGFTRGEQLIRINAKTTLIDTPGVIPADESDEFSLFLVGSKNPQDLSDHELIALKLIEFLARESPGALEKRYGVELPAEPENVLEQIAVNRKKLAKGGTPNLNSAARLILEDWGRNKIR